MKYILVYYMFSTTGGGVEWGHPIYFHTKQHCDIVRRAMYDRFNQNPTGWGFRGACYFVYDGPLEEGFKINEGKST